MASSAPWSSAHSSTDKLDAVSVGRMPPTDFLHLEHFTLQATLYGYNNCDFDFFLTLAKHQRLDLRHALLLMQFLGKVCLNDALHGRVGSVPFLVLVERFNDSDVALDFLEIFVEQALGKLMPDAGANGGVVETSAIRSTLCIELVAKLLHLPHAKLLARIAPVVQVTSHTTGRVLASQELSNAGRHRPN